jgi:hypothetical protein
MDQGAMMTYYYDQYGNVTTNADPQRSTTIAPPVCPNGEQANWDGSGWACIVFTPPAPSVVPISIYGTNITPRAFFQRFGANLAWLYTQAQTNVQLQIYKDQVLSGTFVDLAAVDTANDLAYLLTLSGTPFTAALINAILTAPVQAGEVPT